MRSTLRLLTVASLICATLAPAAAHAQRQQNNMLVELGIDALFARQSFHSEPNRNGQEITTNVNTIDIPLGVIRAGFFLTPNIALEPAFGLHYQHVGNVSTSGTVFDIGLPIYLTGTRRENQIFIRPVVGLNYISADATDVEGNSNSDTQVNVGVGLGIKMPLSDRFAARFEAQYRHAPKSDQRSAYDQIAALAGISVYVH